MRFDRFMAEALYGPAGFYQGPGRAGRRGDFLTSPEVGPLFGAVLARAIDAWWREAGEPATFTVVDAGAGPGTLARAVKAAEPAVLAAGALRYLAVEVSEAQRASHPPFVESVDRLPAEPFVGVVLANELLDNLPFRLFVFDGGWLEAHVARDGDRLVEVLRPIEGPLPSWVPARAPLGARIPVQEAAAEWVGTALARLAAGRLLLFDYVTPRTAELAVRPWREWLRTYRAHDRGAHYLADAGEQDITAQVCLDQLVETVGEPDAFRTQAQFLQRWGIDDLVAEGQQIWDAQAGRPGLAAMAGRSRRREAEALLDPAGLGGFGVLEWNVAQMSWQSSS